MRSRRVRNPNKATTRVSINRSDTYERLPRTCYEITCGQQPVHTFGPFQALFGFDPQVQLSLTIDAIDALVVPFEALHMAQIQEAQAKAP